MQSPTGLALVFVAVLAVVVILTGGPRAVREGMLVKPALPENVRDKGVTPELRDKIQDFMLTRVMSFPVKYDSSWDYATFSKRDPRMRTRVPANDVERKLLAFYRNWSLILMDEFAKQYPNDERSQRLRRNWAKGLVCIDTSGNQGRIYPGSRGSYVMTVRIEANVAKNFNTIAHELAHGALMPPTELVPEKRATLYDGSHGQFHTDTWKLLLELGIQSGWPFVEVTYPVICEQYNICDPFYGIKGAKGVVYSDRPGTKMYGATYRH